MSFTIGGLGGLADVLLGDLDGFKAGFLLELIDIRTNEPADSFAFVMNPTRYDLVEPFQVELTPTEDNTVIPEEQGIITRDIILEGTFGLKERPQEKGSDKISGTEHFFNLRNFLRDYASRKQDPTTAPYIQLHFHSMKDDDHFIVVPREFGSPRDRNNRVHRLYRLRMTAIGKSTRSGPADSVREKNFFDAVSDISKGLHDARASFAEANANIGRIRRRVGNINAIMIQASGFISAVSNFIRSGRDLVIVFPFQLAAQVALQLELAADTFVNAFTVQESLDEKNRLSEMALRGMSDALNRILVHPEKFGLGPRYSPRARRQRALNAVGASEQALYLGEGRLTLHDIDNLLAGADIGTKTRLALGSGKDAGLNLGAFNGLKIITVKRTDSISSLAAEHSATHELLIIINDLRYPYISEGGGPGILKPGDKMIVPTTQRVPGQTTLAPGSQYVVPEDILYGVDIALDLERVGQGVLEILPDKARGLMDAELVFGIPNVIQGVSIILHTELHSTSHVPEIGLRRDVGAKGTLRHTLISAINLRDGIEADPRIASIDSIKTLLDKDVLSQEVTARLTDGRSVTVGIPFGKASGVGSQVAR